MTNGDTQIDPWRKEVMANLVAGDLAVIPGGGPYITNQDELIQSQKQGTPNGHR